jgi:hypothetical protein
LQRIGISGSDLKKRRKPYNTSIYYDIRVGASSPKAMAGLNFA